MSDYTPTTEEVRNKYSGFSTSNSNHTGQVYLNFAEFDRWLAEVKAQALEEVLDIIRGQAEGSQLEGDQKAVLLYEGLIAFLLIHNPYRKGEEQ